MASASAATLESATRGAKSSAALEFLKSSPKKLLINGKWVPSKSGKTFETLNPSNEQVIALVAEGDKADVDEAVKHARKAYEEGQWSKLSPHARTHFLLKIAALIDQHAEELAELETLDNGKPLFESKNIDVPGAAETFRYYAGFATKIYGETNPSDPSTDHPVEFSAADGGVEDCARARMRQRRHPEAGRADAADGDSPRRADLRSGPA
jgi:delta 1-pyrroline-5-carboxylate dehydrogenase